MLRDIQGPLTARVARDAEKWCTDRDRAKNELEAHCRIVASVVLTGEEYAGQLHVHAWEAVAADRAEREYIYGNDA